MSVDDGTHSVEQQANFGGTGSLFPIALAHPFPEGIELLPRPPGDREAGQLEDEDPDGAEPACWDAPRRQGDEAAGAGVDEMSIGSVTSTGQ